MFFSSDFTSVLLSPVYAQYCAISLSRTSSHDRLGETALLAHLRDYPYFSVTVSQSIRLLDNLSALKTIYFRSFHVKLYDLSYSYFSHFLLNFKRVFELSNRETLVFVG